MVFLREGEYSAESTLLERGDCMAADPVAVERGVGGSDGVTGVEDQSSGFFHCDGGELSVGSVALGSLDGRSFPGECVSDPRDRVELAIPGAEKTWLSLYFQFDVGSFLEEEFHPFAGRFVPFGGAGGCFAEGEKEFVDALAVRGLRVAERDELPERFITFVFQFPDEAEVEQGVEEAQERGFRVVEFSGEGFEGRGRFFVEFHQESEAAGQGGGFWFVDGLFH